MATTARKAYAVAVMEKAKQEERGYGARVILINECPDCGGLGLCQRVGMGRMYEVSCSTCGNEPDDATLIKIGKYHYKPLK